MSDEEEVSADEGSEEEEETPGEESKDFGPSESGPSEAQLAMQRRQEKKLEINDDDDWVQLVLNNNKKELGLLSDELSEMRERSEIRKQERAEEEKILAAKREEEMERQRQVEVERARKKREAEEARASARADKMAEMQAMQQVKGANFVINKSGGGGKESKESGDSKDSDRKSKEQLEAEKSSIMAQRIKPLEISGLDKGKLSEKAKELHSLIYRIESEKYDLERRFKDQQRELQELAHRARNMTKVGKEGGIKRVQLAEDEEDKIQAKYAGAPAKIVMFNKFERQRDKRLYDDRHKIYEGAHRLFPATRIKPGRIVKWNEGGQPVYEELAGGGGEGGEGGEGETAAAEEAPAEVAAAE